LADGKCLGLRKIFDNFNIRTRTTGTSFNCSIRFSDSSFEFELGYILEFILETINSLKRRNALAAGNYTVNLSLTNPPSSSSFSLSYGSLPSCFTSLTEFAFSLIENCSMDHRRQSVWRSLGLIWVTVAALYAEVTNCKDLKMEAELAR
jgi:hypothetical protein